MAYKYTVYTSEKQIVQGTVDAASESIAEELLYRTGFQRILSLRATRHGSSLEQLIPTLFGVKTQDVVDFSQQLATLIESGITIIAGLQLLEGQASRKSMKKVISGLVQELREGENFSEALKRFPQVFSHTYFQLIQASEQTGNLEVGLRQVAVYMEKQAATAQRIRRALTYPAMVLIVAAGVFALLITVALPPLVGLFTSLGAELPWMTRLLIATAGLLLNFKLYFLGGIITLIIITAGYFRLPSGKQTMSRLMLKTPVIGAINLERSMFHFCQTMSMLLRAGLHLPRAMDIEIHTVGNLIIRQALEYTRDKLIQGQGLSQPMAEIELFPQLMVGMVVIGEKTGTLDSTLATLANFYERRVDQKIDSLVSMLEPVLTVLIGLVVIFIALSMVTPLYSILRAI